MSIGLQFNISVSVNISKVYSRLEISISMDISILVFYGYIGDISVDIFI